MHAAAARPERKIVTDEQRDPNVEAEPAILAESAAGPESATGPEPAAGREPAGAEPEETPLYGVGPFTVREVALLAVWAVAFVVSFFSIFNSRLAFASGTSVWTSGLEWVLAIGVPTAAVGLIVLRRFSPDGIRRVGSLAVDQFASVAFSVAAVIWLTWLWSNVSGAIASGVWAYSWVVWVEFFLMMAGVFLTVFAPFIPSVDEDFRGRPEVPAHRNARPVRAVVRRPAPEPKPAPEPTPFAAPGPVDQGAGAAAYAAPGEQDAYGPYPPSDADGTGQTDTAAYAAGAASWAPEHARDTFEPVEPEPVAAPEPARQQAFWALAPEERDVVDDRGIPIFRIGPTAWALVIEDRGEAFVVRHEDGRVGYLHDVSGVSRG